MRGRVRDQLIAPRSRTLPHASSEYAGSTSLDQRDTPRQGWFSVVSSPKTRPACRAVVGCEGAKIRLVVGPHAGSVGSGRRSPRRSRPQASTGCRCRTFRSRRRAADPPSPGPGGASPSWAALSPASLTSALHLAGNGHLARSAHGDIASGRHLSGQRGNNYQLQSWPATSVASRLPRERVGYVCPASFSSASSVRGGCSTRASLQSRPPR